MLRPLQEAFDPQEFPDLRVGLAAPDDAAVWRLDDERLLVMTTDFFTPVVDDAYDYGVIAGANALSDVYAMGAAPFMALNIACLPVDLPQDIVEDIFRGLAASVKEAGAIIAGGHTIQDEEPKVGLVAMGFAKPDELITKSELNPGDQLVLTKPLGTGVTATALKAGHAEKEHVAGAVAWMKRLNAAAAELARAHAVRAGTDVTGFGLLGHGIEMARASRVAVSLRAGAIPFLEGAAEYAARGYIAGGSADNRAHFAADVDFASAAEEPLPTLLFDAQTSGGLLLSVPETRLDSFLEAAEAQNQPVWVIGQVEVGEGVTVRPDGEPLGSVARPAGVTFWETQG